MPYYEVTTYLETTIVVKADNEDDACENAAYSLPNRVEALDYSRAEVKAIEKPTDWDD